jgi:hypothetical protein
MALVCYGLGTNQVGGVFIALAVWIELAELLKMAKKFKPVVVKLPPQPAPAPSPAAATATPEAEAKVNE